MGVSSQPSLSDHGHILFILRGSWPAILIRKHRGTDWGSFRKDLRMQLVRGPEISMESEAGLALPVNSVQQALISPTRTTVPLKLSGEAGAL
jgi:hypothetical protein